MKHVTTIITALAGALLVCQGCLGFPEPQGDMESQVLGLSGIHVVAREYLENEPLKGSHILYDKIAEQIKKIKHHGTKFVVTDDPATAAIAINARISTDLLERRAAPGMDQGRYRTTLTVSINSNATEQVVVDRYRQVNDEIYSPTPFGASAKGATWAARHIVTLYEKELKLNYPISKFPKVASDNP